MNWFRYDRCSNFVDVNYADDVILTRAILRYESFLLILLS